MKLKDKLALERFNQVFAEPISGKFHTPQEAKDVYLKGFSDGFDAHKVLVLKLVKKLANSALVADIKALGEEQECCITR